MTAGTFILISKTRTIGGDTVIALQQVFEQIHAVGVCKHFRQSTSKGPQIGRTGSGVEGNSRARNRNITGVKRAIFIVIDVELVADCCRRYIAEIGIQESVSIGYGCRQAARTFIQRVSTNGGRHHTVVAVRNRFEQIHAVWRATNRIINSRQQAQV